MSLVTPSLTYWPNPNTGKPLFNGYVYVGEPDTDPEIVLNQKQVTLRLEDGTTLDVDQPLRLSEGGVLQYNGSYAVITAVGNYSVKALDRRMAQAFYIPNNSSILSSENIDLNIDGTETNLEDYLNSLRNYESVLDMSSITSDEAEIIISFGGFVNTKFFSSSSKMGGAKYIIKTLAGSVDDGDDIDGDSSSYGANHYIASGSYVAILDNEGLPYKAENFGASPLLSDNQLQLQSWLDFDYGAKSIGAGEYVTDNLVIPNRVCDYRGSGRYSTTISCVSSPTTASYLIASSSYANNSTTGNDPIQWSNIRVWDRGNCNNAFIWYGYGSLFENNYFWSQGAGDGFRLTSTGVGGASSSTTLVENKVKGNIIRGNSTNTAFALRDSVNRMTDCLIQANIVRDGGFFMQTTAGANITDNHVYGSSVQCEFRGMSVGTLISNNYFENAVSFNNCLDESIMIGPGNNFNGRVSYMFGASGKTMISKANRYYGISDAYHEFFASDKHLICMSDSFETDTPFVFSSASSTGRITSKGCHSYNGCPLGSTLEGSRTAATGLIRRETYQFSAPSTGAWVAGDINYKTGQSVDVNNMIPWADVCTVSGTPGTWVTTYLSTVSPAT